MGMLAQATYLTRSSSIKNKVGYI